VASLFPTNWYRSKAVPQTGHNDRQQCLNDPTTRKNMMSKIGNPTRPTFLIAALLALVALAGTACVNTERESASEKANILVVDEFMASWDDPDKAVTFLAPNASVRMIEDQPAVVGPMAVAAVFKSFMTPGMELTIDTLSTTVHGPVVLNKRIDTMKTPDKPDQVFPVVGVFVVKNGKIEEWTDYLDH
jgi:limonene-1,2-epoxide hydrolase